MGNASHCCRSEKEPETADAQFAAAEEPPTPVFSESDFPTVAIVRGRKKRVACVLDLTLDELIDEIDSSLYEDQDDRGDEPISPVNLTKENDKIGDHVCPVVGDGAAKMFFSSNKLNKLFQASKEDLGRSFSLEDNTIKDTMAVGSNGGFACAIADPSTPDCPLVFVSAGFESMTGYSSEQVVGRSCRFLQPRNAVLNNAFNMGERKALRDFCTNPQPAGTASVSLLLNERSNGERFWNLLRMRSVEADGQLFILAVQSVLDCFMPKVLRRHLKDNQKNKKICELLGNFINHLDKMRAEIKEKTSVPITELRGYYTAIMNQMEMLPVLTKLDQVKKENAAHDAAGEAAKAATPVLKAGLTVKVLEDIKYPSHKVKKGIVGKILGIDSFGNATVEWQDDEFRDKVKGLLKRDFIKLQIVS
mmetsp:Transcript_95378/g.179364  ORF Transcript_95378/g.179364 Transcript_95378/m.179364 type:complete len:419 (+) Transcript_95378:62-1318(+)